MALWVSPLAFFSFFFPFFFCALFSGRAQYEHSRRLKRAVLRLAGSKPKESVAHIPKACISGSFCIAARFLYILLKTSPGKPFAVHIYVSAALGGGDDGGEDDQPGRVSISNRFHADREVEHSFASLTYTLCCCLPWCRHLRMIFFFFFF